jgi:hypothetical protein
MIAAPVRPTLLPGRGSGFGVPGEALSGVLIPTSAGPVQVDVLEVSDADLNPLPADPKVLLAARGYAETET